METLSNLITETTQEPEEEYKIYIPKQIEKIQKKLKYLLDKTEENKKQADYMSNEAKTLNLWINKFIEKTYPQIRKEKKPRGIARPVKLSEELCVFLQKEKGSELPRTEVTKILMKYIKDNQLQSTSNKTIIEPDSKLILLLGTEFQNQTLTYFTIQKFMNKHYIKNI
jgi:chromatin remodeling complex protein RSC6